MVIAPPTSNLLKPRSWRSPVWVPWPVAVVTSARSCATRTPGVRRPDFFGPRGGRMADLWADLGILEPHFCHVFFLPLMVGLWWFLIGCRHSESDYVCMYIYIYVCTQITIHNIEIVICMCIYVCAYSPSEDTIGCGMWRPWITQSLGWFTIGMAQELSQTFPGKVTPIKINPYWDKLQHPLA